MTLKKKAEEILDMCGFHGEMKPIAAGAVIDLVLDTVSEKTDSLGWVSIEAIQALKEGGIDMDWISVEDRLPEKSGYYLVATSGFYESDMPQIEKFSAHENLHWYGLRTVTHWMPLPDPPNRKPPPTGVEK